MTVAMLCLNSQVNSLVNIFNSYYGKNRHHKLVLNEIVHKVCFADYATDFVANINADFFKKHLGISTNAIAVNELLDLAAAAESRSNHPIAESIIGANGAKPVKLPERVTELAGFGVEAEIDGEVYFVGNARLMSNIGHKAEEDPGTQVHVANKEKYLGYILLEDEIKSEAKEVVSNLKNIGIEKTVILSGDNETAAEAVCRKVGADEVKAELLPGDKVGEVEKLIFEKKKVAFVGDGINDAPVLARADVGFAMGALGSDAAIESADIVLMDDSLAKLPLAVKIAKKTMRIVRGNIWFILCVKAIILALGALGIANMWIAIFGDVGVMVISVLNSMRAMKN
jgi:Cd2+/Zn2+-exporting ATPase